MSKGEASIRVLKGIPTLVWGGMGTYTDDLMVVSALRVCLDYIGDEWSKTYLAGTSGAAFETGWARSTIHSGAGGAVFAHPNHCEAGFDNLFSAIGRKYALAYKSEPDKLWNLAVQSIDAGRPVIATEWQVDHFAILAGYDADKMGFLGRRYGSSDDVPQKYVPIRVDKIGYVLAIGERAPRVSPDQAALGALRFAVSSGMTGSDTSTRGQGGTSHEMVYGHEAFAEHARLVPHQLNPDLDTFALREHFLFWRLDALHLARGYAVLYLQEILEQLPASARKHVKTAVERYCELLGMIESVNIETGQNYQLGAAWVSRSTPYVSLFPPEPGKLGSALLWSDGENDLPLKHFLASVEGRRSLAGWLLRLGDLDRAALSALANALQAEN